MGITYPVNVEYEFSFYYLAPNPVFPGPSSVSLTVRNINPQSLFSLERRQEIIPIPEADGGALITDTKVDADPMEFFFEVYGDTNHSDDTFDSIATRYSQLANSAQLQYIMAQLYDGSSTKQYRRYVSFRSFDSSYVRRTLYRVMRGDIVFDVTDPHWYLNNSVTDAVSVVSGSGSKVTTDTGSRRSNRLLIIITKTGASNPTNPTVANALGQSFQITGSLANVNDYWSIDCYSGTVVKSVSGVVSNDIANFSGRFFGIANTTDTITVTDGGSASYTVSLIWLPRRT